MAKYRKKTEAPQEQVIVKVTDRRHNTWQMRI